MNAKVASGAARERERERVERVRETTFCSQ